MKYEIRDAYECGYGIDTEILNCYRNNIEFEAESDAEAIKFAERLQEADDAKAREVIESGNFNNAEEQFDNAPCYVACLYRVGEFEDEKVEL